ncbi:ImmA/IrrE family metallo-endopeptidase [Cellulosimicrobium funkei]|uniref:ImmA/IrrE family metallo-endopeptidase n=1 Tax=Cellulosimicrobium funkei TaxID=264251 RepID=UPI0036A246CC
MLVKDAARQDATKVLDRYWDGRFPVDPFRLAKGMGIDVRVTSLRPDLSGAIVAENGRVTILVDETDNYGRQAFTCAHELGHFHERKRKGDEDFSFEEYRIPGKYDLHEFYADEFAANLLMPEREFRREIRRHGSDYLAAATFGVSPAAVRKRRERLKL